MAKTISEKSAFWATFPKQHGAWSILLISYLIGFGAAEVRSWNTLVFFCGMLGGFFLRQSGGMLMKMSKDNPLRKGVLMWTGCHLTIFLACGSILIFVRKLWGFVPIGLGAFLFLWLSLLLSKKRKELTLRGELTGIIALSLAAPATEYAASGLFSERTWVIWAASLLYFAGSVFHVRYLVRKRKETQKALVYRLKAGVNSLGYHVLSVIAAVVFSRFILFFPPWYSLALIPNALKAVITVLIRYDTPPSLKKIGYTELAHSLIFSLLAIGSFYLV